MLEFDQVSETLFFFFFLSSPPDSKLSIRLSFEPSFWVFFGGGGLLGGV